MKKNTTTQNIDISKAQYSRKPKKSNLFQRIRTFRRPIAVAMIILFLAGFISPPKIFALTGGPSTPEVNAPSKITAENMVDPFSGNLDYSIPLMEVGDYPLNLSYNADISMDQEASWVGLGWTLNPGTVNRDVRGIPDDFREDEIEKDFNIKPTIRAGLNAGVNLELFGLDALSSAASLGASMGLFYDTYQGVGLNYSLSPSISVGEASKGRFTASMGMNAGSHQEGISLSPSISASIEKINLENLTINSNINSLSGIQDINLNIGKQNASGNYDISFNGFADKSYKPKIDMPMVSTHGTFSFKAGGEIYGTFASGSLTGYYSQNKLETKHKKVPAYGYLYADEAQNKPEALHDFKREKDGDYSPGQPNLPIPNQTFDQFNISGAGISGSFRAHRGDAGIVYDNFVKSLGGDKAVPAVGGFSVEGEIGAGNLVKVGLDLKTNNSENTSGIWKDSNPLPDVINTANSDELPEGYEPFYFKMANENAISNNQDFYNEILDENPASVKLASQPVGKAFSTIHGEDASNQLSGKLYKSERQIRNQTITTLPASVASRVAIDRKINHYPLNSNPLNKNQIEEIQRLEGERKHHHLSEITIRNNEQRYVYGIPAYNNLKKEVSFNTDKAHPGCENATINYSPGKDNSTENEAGLNHFYSSTSTPGYAYSFLLSAIVSDDYTDLTGDGPTPDDLGNYTRFNYSRAHKNYKWRTPYSENSANYQENKSSVDHDNMANYVYGEKEVWFINSIETKNHVARFIVSDRKDGLGVSGENGGADESKKLKKLDKIELYTRADLEDNGADATPLKTVHFEYDYSLTPGVPNHVNRNQDQNNGKLTLTKVYFTYGDSDKGYFSPYKFAYSDENPQYSLKDNDRFGVYKANNCDPGSLDNAKFPYVDQDTAKTNKYINAWKLKHIQLPSGGRLSIDYEPDDYAYVQDRKAMQMFKVSGFASTKNPASLTDKLYDNPGSSDYKVNDYLFFELDKPVDDVDELKNYMPEEEHIFFNVKADVIGNGINNPSNHYEAIKGFAKYENFGLYENSSSPDGYTKGWIKLKKKHIGDYKLLPEYKQKKAHPIAKRAWIYSKNNLPEYAFDRTNSENTVGEQLQNAITSLGEMITLAKSLNSKLIDRQFARKTRPAESFIRLHNADGKKLGGGHRVKKITLSDQWSEMAPSGQEATYGKVFKYETNLNGEAISSGVIAYEPMSGEEENPFYQPSYYTFNGDELFMTEPFGSSFFPGPRVGYSHIEIHDLPRDNVNPAPEGYQVKKFYTAKDFPVITKQTKIQDESQRPGAFANLNPFKFTFDESRAVSQGYKIELNDMHGKPKADYTYLPDADTPYNGVEYHYKTTDNGKLDNTITSVKPDRSISEASAGTDIDFVVDAREQKSETAMHGVNLNTDTFMAAIFPVIVPVPIPAYNKESVLFRSMVTTKVVRKKGILNKTTHYKNGASLSTENIAFDALTGNPVVQKEQNKFGDFIYHTKIPAHHEYDDMGPAYQNVMASFDNVQVSGGEVSNAQVNKLLTRGDQLYWVESDNVWAYNKAWVLENNMSESILIDMGGQLIPDGTYDLMIIQSGYNDKTDREIASLRTMSNPIQNNTLNLTENQRIISAKASEYTDNWQTYTAFRAEQTPGNCNCTLTDLGKGAEMPALLRQVLFADDEQTVNNSLVLNYISEKTGATPDSLRIDKRYTGNILKAGFKANNSGKKYCQFLFKNLDGLDFPKTTGGLSNYNFINDDPYSCDTLYDFTVDFSYVDTVEQDVGHGQYEEEVITKTITLEVHSECFEIATCEETPLETEVSCELLPGEIVNPFINGIRGNWRMNKKYTYQTERVTGNISGSGYYNEFTPFNWEGNNDQLWVEENTTTLIDPFGNKLEEENPLGNRNAEIYGYGYTTNIARVKNAPFSSAGYDGFEDYGYHQYVNNYGDCTPQKHLHFYLPGGTNYSDGFSFPEINTAFITKSESHTGKLSARVTNVAPIEMTRKTELQDNPAGDNKEYVIQKEDYAGIFTPAPGKYLISAWTKDKLGNANFNTLSYDFPKIEIIEDGVKTATLRTNGRLIDGWQKIEGSFDISENTGEVTIRLATDFGIAFFDDIRIHPHSAQMETYVYNPYNMRHTATLDQNNYAIFFQYNEEGEYMGSKAETKSGVLSTKEYRKGSFKSEK